MHLTQNGLLFSSDMKNISTSIGLSPQRHLRETRGIHHPHTMAAVIYCRWQNSSSRRLLASDMYICHGRYACCQLGFGPTDWSAAGRFCIMPTHRGGIF
ncbi:hypothetical protein AVEN_90922-1 [Araneus ventricosus]|uniref:Uncharacterized protein n=1 Tax=Araneus ventricosus TaxID=182803 RepID=A0A4Y2L2V7_ARAVE|nr:hypothetical protein AVEN_90922-1 [Araneus ventricosus]